MLFRSYEDDKCNGVQSVSAVNKLISSDKVVAILGGVCSSSLLPVAPIVEQAKVPMIGYCTTAPAITNAGDYVFRDVPSDLFQGKFSAGYAYNTLAKRKAGIIFIKDDWGVGVSSAFADEFKKLGGSVVAQEGYDPTATDLRTQLTKVKSAGADILYFAGFPDGTIIGLRQAGAMGLNIPKLGADAWDDTRTWKELGSAGDGAMYTVVSSNSSDEIGRAHV